MKKELPRITFSPESFITMVIIWIIAFYPSQNIYAHEFENPETWSDPAISKILKTSKVVNIKPMKEALLAQGKKSEFDGEVFFVTLENGIEAAFKSLPFDEQGDAAAEVAAYQASLYLGFPYIPPTIFREIKGMSGSLQLFVKTPIDLLAKGRYEQVLQKFSKEDLDDLKLFYFVFGQWDSGAHNLLAYTGGSKIYPVAIDNSGIGNHQYVRYGELPFVRTSYSEKLNTNDWGEAFPFADAKTINDPTEENLRKIFGDKFPESFYKNSQFYNTPLKYIIYQNSLWRQFHAFDKKFVRPYVTNCRYLSNDSINKLDIKTLRSFFTPVKGADFLTDSYFKNILERRDQVLKNLQLICEH